MPRPAPLIDPEAMGEIRMRVLSGRGRGVDRVRNLAEALREQILLGRLLPGARLSGEIALAQELGLSRPTVREAIQGLCGEGLLVVCWGVGTFVASKLPNATREPPARQHLLSAPWIDPGWSDGSSEVGLVPAGPDVAGLLGMVVGVPVERSLRCFSWRQRPVATIEIYGRLPAATSSARFSIAVEASYPAAIAALLDREPPSPLLRIDELACDEAQRGVALFVLRRIPEAGPLHLAQPARASPRPGSEP